jgi:hypothetical protein
VRPTAPHAPYTPADSPESRQKRVIFEAMVGAGALMCGLLVSPTLFYLMAPKLIGHYTHADGKAQGVGVFLGDYFGDLAQGSEMAWIVALGPLLMLSFARVMWTLLRPRPEA